jgi:hypothetical protein
MKKSTFFMAGMLAMALIFALAVAGCDNGTNPAPPPAPPPNTFTVTGITMAMESEGSVACLVGLFPITTTRVQVADDVIGYYSNTYPTYCVAYAADPPLTGTSGNKSLSGFLLNPSGGAWRGEGSYHIWFVLYDGTDYVTYRTKNPVTLTAGGSITFDASSDFAEES